MPPTAICPACGSTEADYVWEQVGGAGVVRSWTVVRQPFLPGFAAEAPYVLVDVELECQRGLRLIGRLVDGPTVTLALGARVSLTFEALPEGLAVPAFTLVRP